MFDPKARGAALRAAFLKAAHPEPESEPETGPTDEAEPEPEVGPEPKTETAGKPGDETDSTTEPKHGLADEEAKPANKVVVEPESPAKSTDPIEDGSEPVAAQNKEENAGPEPSTEEVQEPHLTHVEATTEQDEEQEPETDETDIKHQIEKEHFAEYVVIEEDDDDEGDNPEPEEEPSPTAMKDEPPVPAPVPIIEEVKATVIDEPDAGQENNQMVVKPQKLGFFARLKLLFFGGKRR